LKIAIISDIHGNLEALLAVLKDIGHQEVERVACLGDCVGYGADPGPVLQVLRSEEIPSILGNHEEAVYDDSVVEWFNPQARAAIERTRELLSDHEIESFKTWPRTVDIHGALGVHGFPPRSVETYLFEVPRARVAEVLDSLPQTLCFVGHTHTLQMVAWDGERVRNYRLSEGLLTLDDARYIVNVGSVGQPRDGDNRAKYVIWDTENKTLEIRYVAYNISRAAQKILDAGMPEICAKRLW